MENSIGEGYKKYKSAADADRRPYLYLKDLVSKKNKYYHPECSGFYTFGWCSEREMAFNCLLAIMGYKCKIKQEAYKRISSRAPAGIGNPMAPGKKDYSIYN